MKLINLLQSILSVISSAMLYPVMILLVVLFVWMVITTGEFFSEYRERKKHTLKREMKELIESLIESLSQKIPEISPFLKREMPVYFREYLVEFIGELKGDKDGRGIRIEYILQSKEQKMARSLDKLRLMIRIGPTLGLMGTIIPMGPALSALSKGDLEMLSSNIIIAFTTTVVGLAIGITAYFLSMVKNRWIHEDIKNIEYFTEGIMKNKEEPTTGGFRE